jgi:hypothetical protein
MLRKLAVLCIVVAVGSIVVSAQAEVQGKLTLSPSAFKVLFGHKLTLSGMLVGGVPGERVSIEAWPYGHSAPIQLTSVSTGHNGHFSLKVKPMIETTYKARSSTSATVAVTVGVAPSVSIRELSNGHIWTHVNADRSFDQRFVKLQRLMAGGWYTVARKRLSTAAIAAFSTKLPSSSVRIAMSVNEAGAGYLGAASHALGYKAYALTIDAPSSKVLYGHKLILSGRLLNGPAGQTISIYARPYGRSAPLKIAAVKTNASGGWSLAVKPKIQTAYQAHWASAQSSALFTVGVKPVVSVRELGNGEVWAHVQAGFPFVGKLVKLQQLAVGGVWLTVAQHPLNAKSITVFAMTLPTSSIRVAMSVNQAGVGLLGTTSHPLAYHTV